MKRLTALLLTLFTATAFADVDTRVDSEAMKNYHCSFTKWSPGIGSTYYMTSLKWFVFTEKYSDEYGRQTGRFEIARTPVEAGTLITDAWLMKSCPKGAACRLYGTVYESLLKRDGAIETKRLHSISVYGEDSEGQVIVLPFGKFAHINCRSSSSGALSSEAGQ